MKNSVLYNGSTSLAVFITALFCFGVVSAAPEVKTILSYIPRATLFAPPEVLAIKVSPDSRHLAYVKGEPSGVMNLYTCPINECRKHALKQITHFKTPEIYRFFWTEDSKHIVFLQDTNGSKAYQLYDVNIESGKLINHTKDIKNITAKIFKVSGSKVAVGINDRNPSYHDIYILDTNSGSLKKTFKNDRFSRFTFDEKLNLVFKEEIHADGAIDVYKGDALAFHFSPEDAFHSHLLKVQNGRLYYLDTRTSDTTTLKSVNLNTGDEAKLAHDAKSDIGDIIFIDERPAFYSTTWLKKQWHSFGAGNLEAIQKQIGSSFEISSQSNKFWIIRSEEPKKIGASFYLYNTSNEVLTPLFIAPTDHRLADMIPFEFTTRDGMLLTAYITLPSQYKSITSVKTPIPLIVFPHGGPFQARDVWTYNPYHQWLASRGYAVLSVNFRLSSGLGKTLVNAGNGEWGRKAQYDLIDGVWWCIKHGITTKDKVGIMGGSYGGYSTLAGLAFTPETFAVGVDIVGPSSLITVMEKVPNYWDFPNYPLSDSELFFTKGAFIKSMGGSPDSPEGRRFLASRSPLNFASKIESPLLIIQGDNDPIVSKEESHQIFNELVHLKKRACMISFSDEGHQFRRYANIDVFLAYAEKWLHAALGGSFQPINKELLKESSLTIQPANCE
ncbi:MAG: S9 family peptidase [Legionella sp.]|nr:S9 family peptidase [Legionella sp.]